MVIVVGVCRETEEEKSSGFLGLVSARYGKCRGSCVCGCARSGDCGDVGEGNSSEW